MIVARYGEDFPRRIDAVKDFALQKNGVLTFIKDEVRHFKVDGVVYRIGWSSETTDWTIHDDPLPNFNERSK
jgi:hypothetical protein